jgi:hypothetical protein
METGIERKFGVFFTEAHHIAFLRLFQLEKNIDAAICHHTIAKRLVQRFCCFELPIAIDQVLQAGIRQKFTVSNVCSVLLDDRLNRLIKRSDVFDRFLHLDGVFSKVSK